MDIERQASNKTMTDRMIMDEIEDIFELTEQGYTLVQKMSGGACSKMFACQIKGEKSKNRTLPTQFVAKVAENTVELEMLKHEKEIIEEIFYKLKNDSCCALLVSGIFLNDELGVLILERYYISLEALMQERFTNVHCLVPEIVCIQLAKSIDTLHQCKIIHADLKPANILVQPDFSIKLCDFGLSKRPDQYRERVGLPHGTMLFWPAIILKKFAEALRKEELSYFRISFTYYMDVWAYGIIAFQVFTGRYPEQYEGLESILPWQKPFFLEKAADDLHRNGLSEFDTNSLQGAPELIDMLNYIFTNPGPSMKGLLSMEFFNKCPV